MSKAIRDIPKKRGRPKTTGRGQAVIVRMHDDSLDRLDAWIAKQREPMSRPEAIRRLVEAGLKGKGN